MRLKPVLWTLFVAIVATIPLVGQQSARGNLAQAGQRSVNYGQLPLTFEMNGGQTSPQVKFLSRGKGYTAFLTSTGIVLSLRPSEAVAVAKRENASFTSNSQRSPNGTLEFNLVGAANNPSVVGENPQPGRVNYFIGNNPAKWETNIPTYADVRYKNVYPGIDLVYYGNHKQLEYDFAISPGADSTQIQFEIKGASQIELDTLGNLVLQTGIGELHFQSPIVYQESNGSRIPVPGNYVINDPTHIGFRVAPYDPGKPLVIDPVLIYSTYLGGSGDDYPSGIAVDNTGSIYVAGSTDSTDFPLATLGALTPGSTHVFVAKLDPAGSSLVYADYIGGNNQDYGVALVLDGAGKLYVTGSTTSSNFPVVNAYQSTYPGSFNGFLTEVSADGSSLLYSTYLGGNGSDIPSGMAIDSSSDVFVAGATTSTNFPVVNAYQSVASPNQGGLYGYTGFLTKFSPDGSALVYSTYFAGNSNVVSNCGTPCWPSPFTAINGIALDSSGSAYVVGVTNTYNLPTTAGAYLTTDTTQQNAYVGFLSKFGNSGALGYSTYFYESSGILTNLDAVALDGSGSAYVTGSAYSDGTFPITSTSICDPSVYGIACGNAFVTKFDPTGSTLLYSTFLGPNNSADPSAIAIDVNNNAYVLASTTSNSFGIVNGIEPYSNGNDLLLVEIDPSASTELFASYLGGSDDEYSAGIAVDTKGYLYITGTTDSRDFPITPGAFQELPGVSTDGFVLKIGPSSAPSVSVSPASLQYAGQALGSASQPQTVLLRNMGSLTLTISSIKASGDFAESDNCGSSLSATSSCILTVTFTPTVAGTRSGVVQLQDDAAGSSQVINLTGIGAGPGATPSPSSLTFPAQPLGTLSAAQIVTLSNNGNQTLNVGSINVTGDFAETNNCQSTLPANSNCTLKVTFTPTASGNRNGTLTINDSAQSVTQTVNLAGTGSDFSLISSPNRTTVKAGASATYSLSISPISAPFTNAIGLSCSGLPSPATCAFSSKTVTPGAGSTPSTLTITTTTSMAQASPAMPPHSRPVYAFWIQLHVFGLFGMVLTGLRKRSKGLPMAILLVLLVMGTVFMSGCAGGTGIAPQTPPTPTTPAAATYTVTVTAASGTLQHSLLLTLIVE